MHAQDRSWFDEQLELVLADLPPMIKDLIRKIPLVVEDFPSARLCKQLNLAHRDELCGLYVGRSLDIKTVEASGELPDTVYLFREGLFSEAADDDDAIPLERLREEIRLTILHEYGHHHGMDEDELRALGF